MGGDPRLRCPRLRGIPQKKVRQKSFTPKNLPPSGGFFVPRAPKKGAFFFAPAFALRGCIAHCTVRHALRGSPPYPFRIAKLCPILCGVVMRCTVRHALRGSPPRTPFRIAGLPRFARRAFRIAKLCLVLCGVVMRCTVRHALRGCVARRAMHCAVVISIARFAAFFILRDYPPPPRFAAPFVVRGYRAPIASPFILRSCSLSRGVLCIAGLPRFAPPRR